MKHASILSTAIAAVLFSHPAGAADLYWDTNGATAGSTNSTVGVWGTDSFWSTQADGTSATGAYVPGSNVFISAGTNATGTNVIPVTGVHDVSGITFQEGTVTLGTPGSGGFLLGAGGVTLQSGLNGTAVLSTNLASGIVLTASQTWLNSTASTAARTLTANALISGNAGAGETITLTFSSANGFTSVGDASNGGIGDGVNGGNVAVVKTGSASITLGGANTYTGGTTINGGTLTFGTGAGRVPATGMITINAGALSTTGPVGLNTAGAWLSSGKIATTSAGTLAISTTDSSTADFSSYNGLALGASTAATFSGTIIPATTGYRLGGGGGTLTVSSTLDAAANLAMTGGTVILAGDNTYTGTTNVGGGTLILNHAKALGSTTAGTTVASNASLALGDGITVTNEPLTILGAGNGSFGALTTHVASSGTWIGNITLGDSGARLGARTGTTLTVEGAILGSGANQTLRISGEAGTGTIVLKSTGSTYTGETKFIRGRLLLGADNALPTGTVLDMHETSATSDSATLDLNGFNQTIGGLRRTTTNALTTLTNSLAGEVKTLTINQATDTNYGAGTGAGLVTGNLAIVKGGLGTLTLSAANSYTGGTTVAGGRLEGTVNSAFGSGNVTVESTAIRLTIGTGVTDAIADTATLSLAGGGLANEADFGYLSIATGVVETVQSLVLGGIAQAPGTYGSIASGAQFQMDEYFGGTGVVTVLVPEPTTGLTLLAGIAVLLGVGNRRRRLAA